MGFLGLTNDYYHGTPEEVSQLLRESRKMRAVLREIAAIVDERGKRPPMAARKLEDIAALISTARQFT
jgi:hypothetical protein